MVEYFRNGGFVMWVMLIAAIASAGIAATRSKQQRAKVLVVGSVTSIALGLLGISFGMMAVSRYAARVGDKMSASLVAEGLGELSNNGTFAVLLAAMLALGAFLTRPSAHSSQTAA